MTWNDPIRPHGEIQALDERLWLVTGSPSRGHVPRNMVLYRLDGGGLLIHGAQFLSETAMGQLERLGEPHVMLVAGPYHEMDEARYQARYPKLVTLCPEAARPALTKHSRIDDTVENRLSDFGVTWLAPEGVRPLERVYDLAVSGGRALVLGDVLMNLPHLGGLDGLALRFLGSTGFFGMTGIGRLAYLTNRQAFKGWLAGQARRTELRYVCVAHGAVLAAEARIALQQAADRL